MKKLFASLNQWDSLSRRVKNKLGVHDPVVIDESEEFNRFTWEGHLLLGRIYSESSGLEMAEYHFPALHEGTLCPVINKITESAIEPTTARAVYPHTAA